MHCKSLIAHKERFENTLTVQGEHGIGLGKKESLLLELGPATIDVMRSIKRALDPYWLMNPGKVFEPLSEQQPHDAVELTRAHKLDRH